MLNKAIELAGGQGFSAKCFCPTGATKAIESGVNKDVVQTIGHWKNAETFETHYVLRTCKTSERLCGWNI